jgi:hypothetical protein
MWITMTDEPRELLVLTRQLEGRPFEKLGIGRKMDE